MEKAKAWDAEDREFALNTVYEVCGRCRGTGSHTNPNIDGNGLPDEYVQDPEFMADYMNGVYDVRCSECDGLRVVTAVDYANNSAEALAAWEYTENLRWEYEAERAAELRFGY